MRSILRLPTVLAAFVLAAAPGLGAQTPGAGTPSLPPAMLGPIGASGHAVPHPALLALQKWDTLGLTPAQVDRVRGVQAGMSAAFQAWAVEAMRDTALGSSMWTDTVVDEAAVRAALHRAADQQTDLVLSLLRARNQVYAVLDPAQQRLLRQFQADAVSRGGRFAGAAEGQRPERLCTTGSSSGGFQLSPRVAVQYMTQLHGDSARLEAVFVGRAERRLFGAAGLPPRPDLPGAPGSMSGGTIESWYMQYDPRAHVAWVHTRKVPLGGDNVVLVDRVDVLHEPPPVVGTARVPSTVFTGGCRNGRELQDVVRAHLEKSPEIRAFMGT